ncbi:MULTISPECIES: hypothetical protein [Paraburkholderia]|uniref:Uncharacterized protein n=1 Tax=Paraburkholderia unamae TaxID=219649 RepID=A0ACC6RN72_9BURK
MTDIRIRFSTAKPALVRRHGGRLYETVMQRLQAAPGIHMGEVRANVQELKAQLDELKSQAAAVREQ